MGSASIFKSTDSNRTGGFKKPVIQVCLQNPSDHRLVREYLSQEFDVIVSKCDLNQEFDLCIIDQPTFLHNQDEIVEYKDQNASVIAPFLLFIKSEEGPCINDSTWDIIDDVVSIPISARILNSRIKTLLKARRYSLEMKKKNDKLRIFEQIINATSRGVLITDALKEDNPITYVNKGFEKMTGYGREVFGQNCRFLQDDDRNQDALDDIRTLIERGEQGDVLLRNYKKDGTPFWNELSIAPITDENGKITHFAGIQNDVTELVETQRRLKKEKEFINAVVDNMPGIFYMVNEDLEFVFSNQNLKQELGYSDEEIEQMHPFEFFHEEDRGLIQEKIQEIYESGQSEVEVDFIRKNGEARRYYLIGSKLVRDGKTYIIGSAVDISERAEAEFKLEQQKKLLSAVINQTESVIYVKDEGGKYRLVNNRHLDLLGLKREEVLGKTDRELFDAQFANKVMANDRKVLESDKAQEFEENLKVGEETREFLSIKNKLKDVPGYENSVCGISTDITDRKEMLYALQERIKEQICLYNIAKLNGLPKSIEELLNKAVNLLPPGWQYPEITEASIEFNGQHYSTEGFRETKWALINNDKEVQGSQLKVKVVYLQEKPALDEGPFLKEERQLINAIADMLASQIERISAQIKLRESEKRWEQLVQKNPGLVQIIIDDRIQFINPVGARLYGVDSPEELIGKDWSDYVSFRETDIPEVRKRMQEALKGKVFQPAVYEVTIANKGISFVELQSVQVKYKGELALLTIGQEVTDRIEQEQEFKRTNEQLETAQEIAKLGYWSHDVVENQSSWTDQMYDIWEVDPEMFTPGIEGFMETIHPEDKKLFADYVEEAYPDQDYKNIEHRIVTPDGKIKWILERVALHRDENGQLTMMDGTAQDITEQKQRERELAKVNEHLELAQEIAKIGYWNHDLVTNKGEWSEEVYNIWEVDPETYDVTFENFLETIHPADRDLFLEPPEEAFPSQGYNDLEYRIVTPNGKIKWILGRVAIHYDDQGRPKVLEGISQDITEQKNKEKVIREALEEKEILLAEVHHRVKNNLAVVSGLLQIQRLSSEDESLNKALLNSEMRIKSMALIHEKLYKAESLSEIDFELYLDDLLVAIDSAIKTNKDIAIKVDCESVILNVNQAVPCALILNELISNSMEHAFVGLEEGQIVIEITEKNDKVSVKVEDNGKGLPEDFGKEGDRSMGYTIIETLIKQLGADFEINGEGGASIMFSFEKKNKRGSNSTFV